MRPNPHIALIYHYDLARALDGEPVDWQAIPVNVDAGREGGDLCRAAADFAKRRDLFAMPAPTSLGEGDPSSLTGNTDPTPLATSEGRAPRPSMGPTSSSDIAAPVVPADTVVEQTADDQEPDTASRPVPGRAATPDKLRARIAELVAAGHEPMMRRHWPTDVPTLKHDGHTDDQLARILAAVRSVEAQVGAPWHPDDGPPPVVRQHLEDAVDYPTTTIDEGGKIDVAQLAAYRARFDALLNDEQAVCRQIALEAHEAGRSISVSAHPTVRRWSIARAVIAWAASGRSIDEMWLTVGLLATHAQCMDADATLGGLISQFTIEQADRLYDAAQNISG